MKTTMISVDREDIINMIQGAWIKRFKEKTLVPEQFEGMYTKDLLDLYRRIDNVQYQSKNEAADVERLRERNKLFIRNSTITGFEYPKTTIEARTEPPPVTYIPMQTSAVPTVMDMLPTEQDFNYKPMQKS